MDFRAPHGAWRAAAPTAPTSGPTTGSHSRVVPLRAPNMTPLNAQLRQVTSSNHPAINPAAAPRHSPEQLRPSLFHRPPHRRNTEHASESVKGIVCEKDILVQDYQYIFGNDLLHRGFVRNLCRPPLHPCGRIKLPSRRARQSRTLLQRPSTSRVEFRDRVVHHDTERDIPIASANAIAPITELHIHPDSEPSVL